jgi:hypothetical protein
MMGWVLGTLAIAPLGLSLVPSTQGNDLADVSVVTGTVTYAGQPVDDLIVCLDSGDSHAASGAVGPDGSFRLSTLARPTNGAPPGKYRAHLINYRAGRLLPAKYGDPRTSGLEIEIASDWNHVNIDLH